MTREEHLKWCKERAMREIDFYKDGKQGIISMMSDLRKHPETDSSTLVSLCVYELQKNPSIQAAKNFINGFN